MDVDQVAKAVLGHVDLDRAVELTRQVCRVPSVLGEEGPLAALLADTMRESGFEGVGLQPVLPDRPNAIGELDFGAGRRVVLTGHMDTKPVSHGWSVTEPFSGDLIDGRVYGHGIMDMKSALACQIVAMEALRGAGCRCGARWPWRRSADHMGDQRGCIAYFDEHTADLCVLGELSDNEICVGHRGRYYFDVTTHGVSAHTCHKHDAVNANVLAAHAVIELWTRRALKPTLATWVADLFGEETMMVPGRIYGGLPPGGPSMVPDECVIRVDCRPQPGVIGGDRAGRDRPLPRRGQGPGPPLRGLGGAGRREGRPPRRPRARGRAADGRRRAHGRRAPSPRSRRPGWLGDTASFGARYPR